MEDSAFGRGGTYGPDYVPMAGTDLKNNESIRYDYFDAQVGGIVGANVPGVNCNAAAEFGMLYPNDTPYGSSGYNPSSDTSNGQQQRGIYNGNQPPPPAAIHTASGENVVYHNGKAFICDEKGAERAVTINELLSAEEKVKLFAAFINDPVVAKRVDRIMVGATRRYSCGESSRNDFKKIMTVGAFIYSNQKNNNGK